MKTPLSQSGYAALIGPGLTWGQILRKLPIERWSMVHGQCLSVGVGGFLLGGGVNWLGTYNKYGYAAEQVQPKILQRKNAAVKELTPWKLIEGVENEGGDRQWHNP